MNFNEDGRGERSCWKRVAAAAVLAMGPGLADAAAQERFLGRLFQHDLHVVTVTDVSPAGRLLREPSKKEPMYYEALVLGYEDFGRSMAGVEAPDKTAMLKLILKLLADRGYYPGKPARPPEVLLAFAWGTMNSRPGMALPFMGGDKMDMLWEFDPTPQSPGRYWTRFKRGSLGDMIMEASSGPLYVISIQAFDREAALQGKTKLLWQTKVSCPSTGLDITPTLHQMAREAAPYFGRETARPVLKTSDPAGRVDLGELRVLEAIDPTQLPITHWKDERPENARKQ